MGSGTSPTEGGFSWKLKRSVSILDCSTGLMLGWELLFSFLADSGVVEAAPARLLASRFDAEDCEGSGESPNKLPPYIRSGSASPAAIIFDPSSHVPE